MNEAGELIQVVIVAPALSMRLGLRALLTRQPGIEVIGEAARVEDLDRLLLRAQVCLLAERAALSAWRGFEENGPAVLLLLDERPERPPGFPRGSIWGLLPIDSGAGEIAAAVLALAAGLIVTTPGWLASAAGSIYTIERTDSPADGLTPRETEVLQQLAMGLANKQIAAVLGLSENTVKFHISSIYDKLGASNRAEAVRLGARQGWISL